ncbi:ATP-dependent helicase [Candidatus Uabimicrobium amorphum]|uniref:DNA 3'-5' helicase n=2 Tax=Uabimicrobium amorphum TaxID=2596890 RepID=A0A5S9IK10_UABAM|nr:DNA helicase [Candidatus Uabimicrobium amorphum]
MGQEIKAKFCIGLPVAKSMNFLQGLNKPQYEAVNHDEGPLLILAGPGSGKTRVITHRIARLVSTKIYSSQILALTFTNKAAKEMVKRVETITNYKIGWITTFHSFCSRILRKECEAIDYKPDFTIYDADDQKKIIKQVLTELDIDLSIGVSKYQYAIGRYKNHGKSPEVILASRNYWDRLIGKVYKTYQEMLQRNNAFDFDDLLLKTLELFQKNEDVLEFYQNKFQYLLIDEFQDTNEPQYQIAKLLAQEHKNICATGDPDQSIYSWRGANIQNILNFEKDFPDAKVIKLEQNYRSTRTILKVADSLISNNIFRKAKDLWTENDEGQPVKFVRADDEKHEAEIVRRQIQQLRGEHNLSDMVVFYRTNAQSRIIETELVEANIPYTIVGGLEFYKRAEVKDVLAYLKFFANPVDEISLFRIINNPPRGISKKCIKCLIEIARENDISIFEVMEAEALWTRMTTRQQNSLRKFMTIVRNVQEKIDVPISQFIEIVVDETGYMKHIKKNDEKKEEERQANILELLASAKEYEKIHKDANLSNFLQHISLLTDNEKENQDVDSLTLMTLHAAKGLEFPIVFIIGVAEGICPHSRSETQNEIEEERRLLFVGITRAKKMLTISYSRISSRGDTYGFRNSPSRFLKEIPVDLIERDNRYD